jgi:ATP-dependent Lon protease
VLAAHRAGIKTIIIPKLNEKDLYDIPEEIQKKIDFKPVERMQDVLKIAFEKK